MQLDRTQREAFTKQWQQMLARSLTDAAFKQRLMAEPRAVLAEHGVEFPPEAEVRVHEGAPSTIHLMLSPVPAE